MQAAPQVYLAQDLPPGWVVAAADEFGTPYFCNLWTGETQWERPSLATRSTFDYRTPADLVDPRQQWAAAPVPQPAPPVVQPAPSAFAGYTPVPMASLPEARAVASVPAPAPAAPSRAMVPYDEDPAPIDDLREALIAQAQGVHVSLPSPALPSPGASDAFEGIPRPPKGLGRSKRAPEPAVPRTSVAKKPRRQRPSLAPLEWELERREVERFMDDIGELKAEKRARERRFVEGIYQKEEGMLARLDRLNAIAEAAALVSDEASEARNREMELEWKANELRRAEDAKREAEARAVAAARLEVKKIVAEMVRSVALENGETIQCEACLGRHRPHTCGERGQHLRLKALAAKNKAARKAKKAEPREPSPPRAVDGPGQCALHPYCVRGYKHGGGGGRCRIRPPPGVVLEEEEEEGEEEEEAAEEEEVNVPARRQRSDRAKAAFSLFVKSMSGRRPGRDFRFQR